MVQSSSLEANWFAASQEIPHILRNPKVHYRIHNNPPPVPVIVSVHVRGSCSGFVTKKSVFTARSCQHLAQPPKLEDHPLSTVRDNIFNTFAATLHIGGRSSIRNLRTPHAEVTGTLLSRIDILAQ